MIWQSTLAMTVIDVLIMSIAGYTLRALYRHKDDFKEPRSISGALLIALGVTLFGAFYSVDLFMMHGLPSFIPWENAMEAMWRLHIDVSWLVALAGLGSIVAGFLLNNKHMLSLIDRLKSIQDRNELILNSAGEGIYGLDLKGRTTFVNLAAARMIGWDAEELIGKPQHDILHHTKSDGTPYPRNECPIYAAFNDGEIHNVTNEVFWRKDGTSFPVEYISSPIREGNTLVGAVVVFRDITDRKRAEEALQTSEVRLAGIVDIAAEAIISIDESQRIVLFNQGAEAIFGYSADEALGQSLKMLLPARVTEIHDKHVENFAHSSVSRHLWSKRLELCGLRRDGSEFPVEASLSKLQQDGETILTVMLHDISERKQAEEEAQKAKERLEDALEAMAEGFVIFDAQDRLVQCNGTFREWFADLSDLLKCKPTFDEWARACAEHHLVRHSVDDADEWVANRIREHRECSGPYEHELRDGRWISVTEYKTKSGGTAGLRVDITERKHAEQELLTSHRYLEEQARELEETAEQLIQARNHAELANRAKSEFLANMSHELRTPLNAIIGFSEMIQGETFGPVGSPKYREYVKDINDSGQHLLEVINDILDLSKIETRKLDLDECDVDVFHVVRSCITLLKERIETGGLSFVQHTPRGLPALYADKRKFKQILINLLSNAVKFTPVGGSIDLFVEVSEHKGFTFSVSDTGIGIAPDDISKVLTPFFQVESTLNRKYEGTGLGLSLTKALVELHGGTLEIESKVGAGTSVIVRFPAERIVRFPCATQTLAKATRKSA